MAYISLYMYIIYYEVIGTIDNILKICYFVVLLKIMKIAIIGSKGIPSKEGGVEKHVEGLATNLVKLGHEVFVYSRKHYTGYNKKNYKGVRIINLPSIKLKNLDAISHTLLATIDVLRRDVDVIHYHSVGPSTLAFIPKILKRKAITITTFHCKDKEHQKWSKLARLYLSAGEYTSAKFPHQTITVSKNLVKYCKEKFNKEVEYIPNGINIKPSRKTENLDKFGLAPNEYILFVGRLVKHKGVHYLIKAFKELKTDKKLVITGGSTYTDDYVKYIKEHHLE